jgi:hypothetical protein
MEMVTQVKSNVTSDENRSMPNETTRDQKHIDNYIKIRNGLDLAVQGFNEIIMSYAPQVAAIAEAPPELDMNVWKDATGPHGVFQIADIKDNQNNAVFARLTAYLEAHKGKCQVSGFFLWSMRDGSVGRKRVQR